MKMPPPLQGIKRTAPEEAALSQALKKFSTLLGSHAKAVNRIREINNLLHTGSNDEVVLTVPCLDLNLAEEESVLPEVGAHSDKPNMTASVFKDLDGKSEMNQDLAKENISQRISWTRSTVGYAGQAVGTNVSSSFSALLQSRLRAWTLLLLKHSLKTGADESRTRLLSMLAADVQVVSAETDFQALPLPDTATGVKPRESDVVLPLLFEVKLSATIQGKPESVVLRAPGTLSGTFFEIENETSLILTIYFVAAISSTEGMGKLKIVHVRIDTGLFLKAMVDQARLVVLKAVAVTTENQEAFAKPAVSDDIGTKPKKESSGIPTKLQKARTSALRLGNVLEGKTGTQKPSTQLGMRKSRSVKWENSNQVSSLTPDPKKLRMIQTAAKLKSYKSFGRPHAGDFGSGPRNATFNVFGGSGSLAGSTWGRHGRMAQHPMPMQSLPAVNEEGEMTGGSADKNATFDTIAGPPKSSLNRLRSLLGPKSGFNSAAANSGAALLGRMTTNDESKSAMPRTPTVLEKSLMNKWSS